MTACFMRFYKKNRIFVGLCALFYSLMVYGNTLEIKSAELGSFEKSYVLNANFEIQLDQTLQEAVSKGVELSFLVEFQIVKPRKYWFDDEIVTARKRINLSYHALTKQFLVGDDQHQKSFETLSEAIHTLERLHGWEILAKNALESGESYQAALLIRLDKEKLPKAIQVDAIASEDWNLASEIYAWSFKDIK